MAKKSTPAADAANSAPLGLSLSKAPVYKEFEMWLIGMTPMIQHSWSHKAKLQMLQKQVKAVKGEGKETRDPQKDFLDSLYWMDEQKGHIGFPTTAFKLSFLTVAHKDRGIARSDAKLAIYLKADMVDQRPALAGAKCDLPLTRVYGSKPVIREDMGNVGSGLTKKANLIYRAQIDTWAVKLRGQFNTAMMTHDHLIALAMGSGIAVGVGEWRNERDGSFGAYRLAVSQDEIDAWEAYAAGKGPLPHDYTMQQAAE